MCFILRIFEQLALALKNSVCSEFTVLNIYFSSFKILNNLRLPWNTEFSLNFLLQWNIFYYSGLLSNLRLPWKQFALIFFKPGGGAADPPPRTPLVATIHGNFTSKHQTETFKFGRMQHLKFIAWNKWKIWTPKQYEITATLLPHNLLHLQLLGLYSWILHRTSFTLVNLQISSNFETRKLHFTVSYHSYTTLLLQKKFLVAHTTSNNDNVTVLN